MKIIIWGHKLHSHTHSYIHAAFYKAFKHMGYETHWLNENDIIDDKCFFKNCLFLTEGQVDGKIPLDSSNKYILHNCDELKYKNFKYLNIQVYTNGKENSMGVSGVKIENCVFYEKDKNILYQPWATDLLPVEIESKYLNSKDRTACWIGSIWGGYHGNDSELLPFVNSLNKKNYLFAVKDGKSVSFEDNKKIIASHELAPAIVGRWQKINGYIPCRIFKNISYGKLGISNSKTVYELLEENIIFSENSEDLLDLYLSKNEKDKNILYNNSLFLVKEKHTYINRINQILNLL